MFQVSGRWYHMKSCLPTSAERMVLVMDLHVHEDGSLEKTTYERQR